jgi:hypothetical protein
LLYRKARDYFELVNSIHAKYKHKALELDEKKVLVALTRQLSLGLATHRMDEIGD